MEDKKESSLIKIAEALFSICEGLEEFEEKLSEAEYVSDFDEDERRDLQWDEEPENPEQLLDRICQLLCDFYSVKQMAVKSRHGAVVDVDESVNYEYNRISFSLIVDGCIKMLEDILRKVVGAEELIKQSKIEDEPMPDDFLTPLQRLLPPWYDPLGGERESLDCMEGIVEVLKDVGNKLAGIAIREQNVDARPKAKTNRISRQEANICARKLLKDNPNLTIRKLAKEIPCSIGLVSKLPVWKAIVEERKKHGKPAVPKAVRLTDKMEKTLGQEDESLKKLIGEQDADQKLDEVRFRKNIRPKP